MLRRPSQSETTSPAVRDISVEPDPRESAHGFFRTCGLRLQSEIPLPELDPAEGPTDIEVNVGEVGDTLEGATRRGALFESSPNAMRLDVPRVARYLVQDGRRVDIFPSGQPIAVRHFLYGSPLAALLRQRGILALRGSAVRVGQKAVLVLGPSGFGKSRLAASFWMHGHEVLSDDLCAVTLDPPLLHPGPRFLCLPGRDVSRLGLKGRARQFLGDVDRFLVGLPPSRCGPLPVGLVCGLSVWYRSDFRSVKVSGAERARLLIGSQYQRQALEVMGSGPIRDAMTLAQSAPCAEVWMPRDQVQVEELMDEVGRLADE